MTAAPQSGWFHSPPSGLLRWILRLPIHLYRLGLGRLLGHRFLLLTHRGRRSGRVHHAVLEVIRYDRRTGECIVGAGWGERAEWYRNLRAHPALAVAIGGAHYVPVQRFLTPVEAEAELRDYAQRHPLLARAATHLFHTPLSGEVPIPMVAFRPPAAPR